MIIKDNELPIIVTEEFGTFEDDQESVAIEIYESTIKDGDYAVDQEFYKGQAVLPLPPRTPADTPISVTMELSDDGTLKIRGINPQTGEECRGEFQSDCVLKEDEFKEARSRVTALTKTMND
jgi:molecular chaperone DnaK (HSP70)